MLFRLPVRENRRIIPRVTFTDPELAHVGLTEAEAGKIHGSVRILRWPYAENDRAQTEHRTEGHMKMVTGRRGKDPRRFDRRCQRGRNDQHVGAGACPRA